MAAIPQRAEPVSPTSQPKFVNAKLLRRDDQGLATSFTDFVGINRYHSQELREDLTRFAFLPVSLEITSSHSSAATPDRSWPSVSSVATTAGYAELEQAGRPATCT